MRILTFLKNIIFPPRCVFCDRIMEPNVMASVCGKCSKDLDFCTEHTCCRKCGKPIVSFAEKQWCYFCLNEKKKYFDRISSVFVYDGNIRESILRYKFSRLSGYSKTYAECMAVKFFEEFDGLNIDCICAVPSHSNRKTENEFDHVGKLCKGLEKIIEIKFERGILKKIRKTKRQSLLSYEERRKNLDGSIIVKRPEIVESKRVLLVDDICTTRSTIMECSKMLKQAGASKVYALTIATTLK